MVDHWLSLALEDLLVFFLGESDVPVRNSQEFSSVCLLFATG